MEILFMPKDEITNTQQEMLNNIEKTCFGFSSAEIIENGEEGHPFGAVELGAFLLFDDKKIVGNVFLYKRLTEYDGQDYFIGGAGGLAVTPEYRKKGYARQLMEKALKMAYDVGVDVACLFTNREESIYKLYEKLGYAFINRNGYYIDSLGNERFETDVMIIGFNNKELQKKYLPPIINFITEKKKAAGNLFLKNRQYRRIHYTRGRRGEATTTSIF